jgi:F0F1-type ATP synthase assembly protein I
MEDKKKKVKEFMTISRLTSVGIQLILCTMIGWYIGGLIDKHFHTSPVFTLFFLLMGIGAGMIYVFRTLGKIGD